MTYQEKLNAGEKVLRKVIERLDDLTAQAGQAADERCKAGDNAKSAEIRAVEAELRIAAGRATSAYTKGRALDIGGIMARSGDK